MPVFRFTPTDTHKGLRLDIYLPQVQEDWSRTFIRRVIDLGGVHVAARRVRRCSQIVRAGEQIEVFIDGFSLDPFRLESEHVLFQDAYLIVINKPAGIESQPTPARFKGTVYEALGLFLQNPSRPLDAPNIGMMQRLDRETSGVMVFSTHVKSHQPLTHAFRDRHVDKRYLALVNGIVEADNGEFRSLLARQRSTNRVKSVQRGGKEAITRYRVKQRFSSATLVEIELLTGRSHQIRAHFSEAGHPLLGDRRYGGPASLSGIVLPRTLLHSWRLNMEHPVLKEDLQFEAPLPDDFLEVAEALGHLP